MEGDLDNLKATELTLGLPGSDAPSKPARGSKRVLDEVGEERLLPTKPAGGHEAPPPAKAPVVGWPPIRSYRKNSFQARKAEAEAEAAGAYVKVSMDGAPYLRKVDLRLCKGYKELRQALEDMFKCFSLEKEGHNGSDHAITYEDKDGDWMLVGDVPWGMFISSCKRLRIMKGSEARGLGSSP